MNRRTTAEIRAAAHVVNRLRRIALDSEHAIAHHNHLAPLFLAQRFGFVSDQLPRWALGWMRWLPLLRPWAVRRFADRHVHAPVARILERVGACPEQRRREEELVWRADEYLRERSGL